MDKSEEDKQWGEDWLGCEWRQRNIPDPDRCQQAVPTAIKCGYKIMHDLWFMDPVLLHSSPIP